ncbi:hypothetical protein fugu_016858 [Takifugu bimaculatus]|uniref:PH domain-containing protein n=1 Tax=Takifugu bimaculatus TaxID=433685 RepID=A0A4Z2BU57_9TELE|nr:hypothetical protein fugu_016858 [Takifugu bimaculatus]
MTPCVKTLATTRRIITAVRDTGAQVTQGQEDDPQYQQLEQRLNGLDRGWYELQKMWDSRKNFLDQGLGFQQFMRDCKAVEAILNNQEYTLAHIDKPDTLAGAEKALKKHEDFESTMEANEDKIDGTLQSGQRLVDSNNLYSGKIQDKMDSIKDRHSKNKSRAQEVSQKLRDNRDLQHFLQNTQDLTLWINEKMLTAQDTSYDEARNLHSKWLKHQAFMAELASNKGWLDKVDQQGQALMETKPEFEPIVKERLAKLHELWDKLESTTQEKARLLFDANRSELFDQSLADMKKWLGELQQQLQSGDEEVKDLTNANILLKKHQMTENQVRDRARELEELQEAVSKHGGAREDQPELEAEQQALQREFQQLLTPLDQRRGKLEASKAVHQFYRDLADELLWIEERMPLAMSQEHGHNLQTVQMLLKKNQTLQREIEGHQPRVDEAADAEGRPEAERITEQLEELEKAWAWLQDEMAKRRERLKGSNMAQHEEIIRRQGQVDKQYAGLRELAEDRRKKLDHTYHHFLLNREVEDLEHWISERDVVASSQEMGQDLDHVMLLRDRFREFARETGMVGQERVDFVNLTIDELIEAGHAEACHHGGVEGQHQRELGRPAGADRHSHPAPHHLLRAAQVRTRSCQGTIAVGSPRLRSFPLLRYFDDGTELVAQIHDKLKELPDDVGEDFSKAESFHRMHAAFERDITALGKQVQQFQETASRLHAQYAGGRAESIQAREREVVEAWKCLLDACDGRRAQLVDTADKFRFFTMVRDLMAWMESIIQQIEAQEEEKPRDVSSVELLQKYHQGIRSEIEARGAKFTDCADLGKALLTRKHRDSAEIKEKLLQLNEKQEMMMLKWDDRWDWLRLLLEVCQFARDASVAEAWLIAQEPYVTSRDLGFTADQVEKLLKRHEAFEKSTAAWEERFSALERLTTLELMELRKQQQDIEDFLKQEQRSDSRRDDTGFGEESSQPYTAEEPTVSAAVEPGTDAADATAAESTLPIESMKESGSLELEPSVSLALPAEPEKAATMPVEASRAQTVLQEGPLGRKHDVEGSGKKSSNRSWNNLYCVLKPGQLSAYKDAKSFGHGATYHGEEPLALAGAHWEVLTNYKKKKHVFKLRLGDGSEYLFQCKDEEELQRWSQAMHTAIQQPTAEPSGPPEARAQTLPAPFTPSPPPPEPSSTKKDKEKKFGRFAKKK